jgi:hypothetical protein
MTPGGNGWLPSQEERTLLLRHYEDLRVDQIRDFMRAESIAGLANNKPELIEAVKSALRDGDASWQDFVNYLDQVEPYRKQRVYLLQALEGTDGTWSPDQLRNGLATAGQQDLLDAKVPIAVPATLQLSSVTINDSHVEVLAIGRRTYRHRVKELEGQVQVPRAGLEVQLYEYVHVRAWVRLELDLSTGSLAIRASRLPQERLQDELYEDFLQLASWFPLSSFNPLNLRKAIETLHADEVNTPHEARVQAVGYDSATGLRSSMRGATGQQSVTGHGTQVDGAIATIRNSSQGEDGNFFFLPPNNGGPPGTPLKREVRTVVQANDGRVDFPRPLERDELQHVLRRVRVLAT